MDSLPLDDVARLIRLLAEACDPELPATAADRKRLLMDGVAQLVGADVWIWNVGIANPPEHPGDAAATHQMSGGWKDSAEQARVLCTFTDATKLDLLQIGIMRRFIAQQVTTVGRDESFDPQRRDEALREYAKTGLADSLVAVYPLSPTAFSAFGLHRRRPAPDFGPRERAIVQLVLEQVGWLHRHGTGIPADDKVMELSARQRQVLLFLLAGDTQRQISLKMEISPHTVNDHVKQIYRRFDVNSKGELFAHFVNGGQAL